MGQKHYYDSVAYRSLGATTIRDVNEKKYLQPYFRNLKAALADNTVSNIAVFGKFGAGKTTVIKSFLNQEKHNPEIRPLSLSLATFTREADQSKQSENVDETNKSNENHEPKPGEWVAIERNLVQQMLYGPSNNDLPDSKYRKIESGNTHQQQRLFALLCGLFLSIFVLWDPWHIVGLIFNNGFFTGIKFVSTIVFLICFGMMLKHSITHFPRWFGSAKLGWGKSELAIKDNQSAFNEYLDEIIYFFSQKKYNLVVLEDIDRFNNLDIFEHLRELNQILNKSEVLRQTYGVPDDKPAVKFVYAVKEDLFNNMSLKVPETIDPKKIGKVSEQIVAEATTKFFDWTMTVLPKVSTSNSADFLMEMFENPTTTFRDYLRAVSIYFDDVRVLENTINDFKLHSELQEDSDLDAIKMLTILLFKNGFPKEYQRFVQQEGSLSKIVRTRWLATELIHDHQTEISRLEEKKRKAISIKQNEVLVRYKALMLELGVNVNTVLESPDGKVKIDSVAKMSIQQLTSFYQNVRYQTKRVTFGVPTLHSTWAQDRDFTPTQLIMNDEDFSSDLFFKNISDDSFLTDINRDIQRHRQQMSKVSSYPLLQLITENKLNISNYLEDVDEAKGFLGFSIVNGYLDETVDDYLAYFSGTRISLNDRQVVRRLRSGDAIPFEEPIDNVGNFVGDLLPSDLQKPSIQLGELIAYVVPQKALLVNNRTLLGAYEVALRGLANENSKVFSERFDWLLDHVDVAYYVTLIVDMMSALNNNWSYYSGRGITKFARSLIEELPEGLLTDCIDTMPTLSNFINENKWKFTGTFITQHAYRSKQIFSNKNIILNRLDPNSQADLTVVDYLIESNALACNESTVPTVLTAIDNGQHPRFSYQLIQSTDDVKIKNWINKNFENFVKVEIELNYISNESSASLTTIMTHAGLSNELISKVLEQYSRVDLQLSDIHLSEKPTDQEKYVVQQIIETKHMAFKWSNLSWLTAINRVEWRDQALTALFSTSNYLEEFDPAADSLRPDSIRALINSIPIRVTDRNKDILKQSEQCNGLNQDDDVLSFLINENLVVLSDALVDRVTTQDALLQLVSHCLDVNESKWNETQTKLFGKLDAHSLFKIVTGKVVGLLSVFKIAVDALVKNHLQQSEFTDINRGELLEAILSGDIFESTERRKFLTDIFNTYQSGLWQFRELTRLIVNNQVSEAEVRIVLSLIRDTELSKIVATQTGKVAHMKDSPERLTFVRALYQIGLVSKPRILKTGNKDISVKVYI